MNKKQKTEIHYDKKADVLYIVARRGAEDSVHEISPGINVELDAEGEVIGIEIFNASKNLRSFAKAVAVQGAA